jgi:1L-myo-inositol 1-phosphate cytidylyltransferase / CDP-L-myo-inositol myo-inositolphosphotransferase
MTRQVEPASPVETLGQAAGAGPLLVVVPSATDGVPSVSPASVVAGLPLITRIVRAAMAAGYEQVFVCDMGPAIRRLADGTGATVLTPSHDVLDLARRRMVVVPANVVPQSHWLRSLLEMPIELERLHVDGAGVVVVETEHPGAVLAAAARAASAIGLVAELSRVFGTAAQLVAPEGRFPLASGRDIATAETWLLQSLIKHNEGFMSRHFERRISLALTRRLVSTPVTPNAMTLTSVAIGLAGAPFFLSSSAAFQLAGGLLFLTHSILDGCDGELARLKFLQSRRGAILDYWGDNAVHVAVFVCMAVGWALSAGTAWPLVLGASAAAASLGSAALMFEHTAADRAISAESPRTARLTAALANRDFIYVVILLSTFGKAWWFVATVAAGAPAFLLVILWSRRRDRAR